MSLTPLSVPNKLAKNPTSQPKYAVEVKNKNGDTVKVGCPQTTRGLLALMNQHAVIGGAACHWGGPAAFAEMMSAIHGIMFTSGKEWFDAFNFVNDAGHAENGIYALRANYGFDGLSFESLRDFRSIKSKLTGHGEAHLNPEQVFISNGPLGSGVPQAQGLCLADKLIGNDRTTLCVLSDGGSMEGETKEAFAAIPGLAKRNKMNPFVLVISDNNTKLSGRIDKDSFNMEPTFSSLKELGWNLVHEEEGHNLQKVYTTLENAIELAKKDPTRPVALVIKTIKGYGVKSTEESSSGGHGYPLKAYDDKLPAFLNEIFAGNTPSEFTTWANDILASKPAAKEASASTSTVKSEKVQPGFSRAAITAVKNGLPVFSVSSDLQGSTGIADFQKAYPENYIDIGIAESNMVSTAIGLSKQGFIPVVDTFAQFGITKGNLPLIMAGLSEAPVIGLFSHTGFQDAADGASHQATTYFAATSSIPHVTVISCSCSSEAEAYMTGAIEQIKTKREKGEVADSVLFFYGRENHPAYYKEGLTYEWKKAQVLAEGSDVTIVANGPMVAKALEAKEAFEKLGKSATIINNPFINHPDVELIATHVAKTGGKLITIEDHQLVGGMGAQIVHALKLKDVNFKARSIANNGKFGQSAYTADDLYDLHAMNVEGILNAYKEL
ncbi:transketolase, pyridine binding domain protein [Bacteriovorax sp. BSW11_IV]|uniref:transketolase C-terminal domain-containing protein n=1 Tax=Bacteriovorax sp. BSW11_IV TaxID=1353529 RepID=UPI00038A212D|nr:transketolase C-terminal domain-containing protein [Bacteriovorax sp. BSW11_IV]EQC48868.1 transketolase, pyridine binding domain protein [Bacteriovorax sp. BSW11_IV]